MEANPISGALRFELPDAPEGGFRGRPLHRDGVKKAGKHMVGKRGRPANIRHKGKRR
jgi:ribonuclease R